KQPTLGPASTAKREPLPPAEIGEDTVVSSGAIVFAGSTVGPRSIVGDQSCIRERVQLGENCVLGRGSLIENDTTVGPGTRIQAGANADGLREDGGEALARPDEREPVRDSIAHLRDELQLEEVDARLRRPEREALLPADEPALEEPVARVRGDALDEFRARRP